MKDPLIDELRKHRMEHTRQFDGNLHRICEDLREFERSLGSRVVAMEPKRKARKQDDVGHASSPDGAEPE